MTLGNVVVITLEPAFGNTKRCGERVQFLERGVADQVAPEPIVRGPNRCVDQDGHVVSKAGDAAKSR